MFLTIAAACHVLFGNTKGADPIMTLMLFERL